MNSRRRLAVFTWAASIFSACVPQRSPQIAATHPSRPHPGSTQVAAVPDVLDTEAAVRRDPAAKPATMLHPDMPAHEMKGAGHGDGHDKH